MANQYRHKQRVLCGIDDGLAADFDTATCRAGSDRSAVTRRLWGWYARRPGQMLPARPPTGPRPDTTTAGE